MPARDRAEHQDDDEESRGGRRRVLEELQAGVARWELLGRDPGADDDGEEERTAQELSEQSPPDADPAHRFPTGRRRAMVVPID